MDAIYTWRIVNTTIKNSPDINDIVVDCSWVKVGQYEDGSTGFCYGNTRFDDVNPESFIMFDELTEDVVLSWVHDRITEEQNQQINKYIEDDMRRRMYPEKTVTPPWIKDDAAAEPDDSVTPQE